MLKADTVLIVGDFNIHVKRCIGISIYRHSELYPYVVSCILNIAKTVNSTPCYKYGRTITSTTKD